MVTLAEFTDVNLWAVVVAAAAAFGFGTLWYSPLLFGKDWTQMSQATYKGLTDKAMRERASTAMVGTALVYLVMAYVLAYVMALVEATSVAGGLAVAGWIAAGFVVTHDLIHALYHNVRKKLWLMNALYNVGALLIIGAILGAWQ